MTVGRPPVRPRARAAARPSRVPATMISRMNSARAAKTWNTSRPPEVVVSRFSCSEVNPTSRRRRSPTVVMRSCRERESRSRDGTTRVSPGAMKSRQATNSGRAVSRPDCFSAKIRRQPAVSMSEVACTDVRTPLHKCQQGDRGRRPLQTPIGAGAGRRGPDHLAGRRPGPGRCRTTNRRRTRRRPGRRAQR